MAEAPTWPLSGGGGSKGSWCSTRHQLKKAGFNTCAISCQENGDMKPSALTVTVFLEGVNKCYGRDQGARGTLLLHQFSIDPRASPHTSKGDLLCFRAPGTQLPITTTTIVISDLKGHKSPIPRAGEEPSSRGHFRSLNSALLMSTGHCTDSTQQEEPPKYPTMLWDPQWGSMRDGRRKHLVGKRWS